MNPCNWPRLVAIEGPSGCGKSSLIPELEAKLVRQGICAKGVSNSDLLRWSDLIRGLARTPEMALTLAYATAGARADLRESHGEDTLLLCDRYVLSSLVYQRFAGVPLELLYKLNSPLVENTITFSLLVDLDELERRRAQRQRPPSDWFKETLTAADEIRLYAEAVSHFETFGSPLTIINAAGPPSEIADTILSKVSTWVAGAGG